MSQYSTIDPGLPYGENNPEGGYYQKILSFREPRGGLTGIEYDLIRIQDPVKKAYKDLITNWWFSADNTFYYPNGI